HAATRAVHAARVLGWLDAETLLAARTFNDHLAGGARAPLLVIGGAGLAQRRSDNDRIETVNLSEPTLPIDHRVQLGAPLQVQIVDGILGDDDEEGEVDGVHAFAENHALPAALAARRRRLAWFEKTACILKVVARGDPSQYLTGRERLAVAGVDVADLA